MAGLPIPKQSKSVYEKYLTSKHLLQNLRSYNLAAGSIDPLKYVASNEGNEERLLASLVRGETSESVINSETLSTTKQRKRKRRRNKSFQPGTISEPENLSTKEPKVPSFSRPSPPSLPPPSLSLVADYSDSDTENEVLEIPQAIKDMYKSSDENDDEGSDIVSAPEPQLPHFDSDSDPERLGFFQASSESDPESTEDAKIMQTESIGLSSYNCGRCGKAGHLTKHCTVLSKKAGSSERPKLRISPKLRKLYSLCKDIRSLGRGSCAECGIHSNLVHCLDCRSIFCDGRGHLSRHLSAHPSHKTLYSYKLDKLMKCCKADCSVVNVYQLLMCSHCLSKSFSQHYSMITATWSSKGLKTIMNALCCDEHFQWHRMNCSSTAEEYLISQSQLNNPTGLLSEFFF